MNVINYSKQPLAKNTEEVLDQMAECRDAIEGVQSNYKKSNHNVQNKLRIDETLNFLIALHN